MIGAIAGAHLFGILQNLSSPEGGVSTIPDGTLTESAPHFQ
mgnify:CR=1 FL=1